MASTLLGSDPPVLPARLLVRSGELFGIAEGTTRTALSRMVANGELEVDDGRYRLTGRLLQRQARQTESRRPTLRQWRGGWLLAVVVVERRPVSARADLRDAMRTLRLAEQREGVWLRPDNLPDPSSWAPGAAAVVAEQCRWWTGHLRDDDPATVAAGLWDLRWWATEADALRERMAALTPALGGGDLGALAPGFVVSAAVLRHVQADPLLPDDLLPPGWPGAALRAEYDDFDAAYRSVLRAWFRAQRRPDG